MLAWFVKNQITNLNYVSILGNNNKILNTGNLQDDSNSEKFYVYPDSLKLRANWELEIEDWEIN